MLFAQPQVKGMWMFQMMEEMAKEQKLKVVVKMKDSKADELKNTNESKFFSALDRPVL